MKIRSLCEGSKINISMRPHCGNGMDERLRGKKLNQKKKKKGPEQISIARRGIYQDSIAFTRVE